VPTCKQTNRQLLDHLALSYDDFGQLIAKPIVRGAQLIDRLDLLIRQLNRGIEVWGCTGSRIDLAHGVGIVK
jgi:hypothetical protein